MLENVKPRDQLTGFARQQARPYMAKTIHVADIEKAQNDGWEVQKRNKRTVRVTRPKPKATNLEDRVWTLLHRLGFTYLSGQGGAQLIINPKDEASPKTQVDCVAVDDEAALAIECKTFQDAKKDSKFQEKLAKHAACKRPFAEAVKGQFPADAKRAVATVLFTWDYILTEQDGKRAEEQNVVLLDEADLSYYETLVSHLGPAARYQFLADVFPGRQIPGLQVRVPALRTKVGEYTCYTFAIQPEYLLKIAFVSHRARGKATDVDAYQRMIQKSRLKKIREYISDGGNFPTNIVLNLEKSKYSRFDIGKQEGTPEGATVGWLTLTPAYKSAWVIDGQHRLFAYSGHERAAANYLNVLAFDELPGDVQAKLFVDINHEQKSVKRSLLDELWAELHWQAEDPEKRVRAVISKAIQGLNADKESPLYRRILLSDASKDHHTCISLSSVLGSLTKPGFYLMRPKKNIIEYGPLWAGTNDDTMRRTITILNAWFREISTKAAEWWSLGSGEGGGLAMNEGVTICINVLRSVFDHLEKNHKMNHLADDALAELTTSYGIAVGDYFGAMLPEERAGFRALRGVQGQTTGTRLCQEAIQRSIAAFDPPGLKEFVERSKSDTNQKARQVIDRIEKVLQDTILEVLKEEYPTGEEWWFEGVPQPVRKKVGAPGQSHLISQEMQEYLFQEVSIPGRFEAFDGHALLAGLPTQHGQGCLFETGEVGWPVP
jgi:DNA sulfur modification protein DndB